MWAFSVVDGTARRGTPRDAATECFELQAALVTCTYFLVTGKVTPRLNALELQAERAKEVKVTPRLQAEELQAERARS